MSCGVSRKLGPIHPSLPGPQRAAMLFTCSGTLADTRFSASWDAAGWELSLKVATREPAVE